MTYISMNRKWLFYIFSAIFAVTALAGFLMYKLVEDDVESVREEQARMQEPPPKTATEILAAELAGEPEAFPKATEEDINRPPAESRTAVSLEDEFDSMAPDRDEEPAEPEKPKRTIASVPKKMDYMFKVESSKSVISKNIDRKKALAQLRKDFARDDCSANTGKSKSIKATVNFAKDGSLGKVSLSPSTSGDKELTKCLKKKITAKAKGYKSKDKKGGKITLTFKVK